MDSWDGEELALWFKDKFTGDGDEIFSKEKADQLISFAKSASTVNIADFIQKIKAGETVVGIE